MEKFIDTRFCEIMQDKIIGNLYVWYYLENRRLNKDEEDKYFEAMDN